MLSCRTESKFRPTASVQKQFCNALKDQCRLENLMEGSPFPSYGYLSLNRCDHYQYHMLTNNPPALRNVRPHLVLTEANTRVSLVQSKKLYWPDSSAGERLKVSMNNILIKRFGFNSFSCVIFHSSFSAAVLVARCPASLCVCVKTTACNKVHQKILYL